MTELMLWMKSGQVHSLTNIYQVEIMESISIWIRGAVDPIVFPMSEVGKVDVFESPTMMKG